MPDDGETYCAACIALWKAALVDVLGIDAEWVQKNLSGPEDAVKVIGWPRDRKAPQVDYAVTWAPSSTMGMLVVPVCLTHAPAADLTPPPPPPPPGMQRPRLIPGMS